MIQSSDISFVLSGGSNNTLTSSSLGGEPSNTMIGASINNLFDDVSSAEAEKGIIDYRCFYIFNDHETETLYDTAIYVESQVTGGATIQLGAKRTNDIQNLSVSATEDIVSGTITLNLEGNEIILFYDPDLGNMQQSLEDSINALNVYNATVVASSDSVREFSFSITFDEYKYFELISIVGNDLITSGVVTLEMSKNTDGGPVNTFAEIIANEVVSPSGVVFQNTSSLDNALIMASLRPGEGFPVWVKRVVPINSDALQNDNFIFILTGNPA